MSIAFTGHREFPWGTDESSPSFFSFRGRLEREVQQAYEKGFHTFLCGMALGADFAFADAVLSFQDMRRNIDLIAAIPGYWQTDGWSKLNLAKYNMLLSRCAGVHSVSEQGTARKNYLYHVRNRWMIDHAHANGGYLIAAYDGRKKGGTYETVLYAKQQGVPIVYVPPQ